MRRLMVVGIHVAFATGLVAGGVFLVQTVTGLPWVAALAIGGLAGGLVSRLTRERLLPPIESVAARGGDSAQ
jgi:hypothetical protein